MHEQYKLLFLSLDALFMFHEQCKKKKNSNAAQGNANPNAHWICLRFAYFAVIIQLNLWIILKNIIKLINNKKIC